MGEIKKGNNKFGRNKKRKQQKKIKEKKAHYTILKRFTKQETRLLIFLMIILQWYVKQKMKQLKEQDSKY